MENTKVNVVHAVVGMVILVGIAALISAAQLIGLSGIEMLGWFSPTTMTVLTYIVCIGVGVMSIARAIALTQLYKAEKVILMLLGDILWSVLGNLAFYGIVMLFV